MYKRLGALATVALLVVIPATSHAASHHPRKLRLLVEFQHGTNRSERNATLRHAHASVKLAIPHVDAVSVTVPRPNAADLMARLRRNSAVVSVQPDARFTPQDSIPDDPFFPAGSDALVGGAWGWTQTHTTQAWDVTRGTPNTVVAVLDTGLRPLPDFAGQTVPGWNVLNGTSDTATNSGTHGTYVAGVIGLAAGNDSGNAGYCPGCRIMPVQIGTDSGAYLSDMATGIIWAADHGARVENLSWAGPLTSQALTDAVSYARSKGVVVVAAAGNSNCNCATYPASTPGVLGVAGTDQADNKQGDSNYGSWVAVAAPESNMTAWPTLNGSPGYAPVGGTSLASPVVAAIAGLAFSADPGASGTQVENAIESSAKKVSFPVRYGRVDAMGTLAALGFSDPQPSALPAATEQPSILVASSTGYDTSALSGAPQVGEDLVRGQGAWTGSSPLSVSRVTWYRCDTNGVNCSQMATTPDYVVQQADMGYTFMVAVTVSNSLGSVTAASQTSLPVGGSWTPPPPANSSLPAISGTPQDGQTLTASTGSWSGSPAFTYQWRRCDATGANCAAVPGATAASYAVASADVGDTLSVVVTATNGGGSTSATSPPTTVVANAPPPPPPSSSPVTSTFSGSISGKSTSKSFMLAMGAGASQAQLSFSRCSSLSLGLSGPGWSSSAPVTGPSVLVLNATVGGGTYTYTVSGAKCAFTLTVTAQPSS
jgi:hypothetical protein